MSESEIKIIPGDSPVTEAIEFHNIILLQNSSEVKLLFIILHTEK